MAVVVTMNTQAQTINHGATLQLSATVTGFSSNNTVTWSKTSGVGSINGSGLFTGSASGSAVLRATSVEDNTKNAEVTITVATVAVAPGPASPTVIPGDTLQLTGGVTGAANTAVTWSKVSGNGSVNASTGVYTAGLVGTDVIRATSAEDGTKTGDLSINVAYLANNAHRVHLLDRHNEFIQNVVREYLNKLDKTSAEYTLGKAALDSLAGF